MGKEPRLVAIKWLSSTQLYSWESWAIEYLWTLDKTFGLWLWLWQWLWYVDVRWIWVRCHTSLNLNLTLKQADFPSCKHSGLVSYDVCSGPEGVQWLCETLSIAQLSFDLDSWAGGTCIEYGLCGTLALVEMPCLCLIAPLQAKLSHSPTAAGNQALACWKERPKSSSGQGQIARWEWPTEWPLWISAKLLAERAGLSVASCHLLCVFHWHRTDIDIDIGLEAYHRRNGNLNWKKSESKEVCWILTLFVVDSLLNMLFVLEAKLGQIIGMLFECENVISLGHKAGSNSSWLCGQGQVHGG